LVTPRIFH